MHKLQMYYPSVNKLVSAFFAQSKVLMGKPQYKTHTSSTHGLFVVRIPYFAPLANTSLNDAKVAQLGSAITRLVNHSDSSTLWKVEIRLIRLQYPYLDSSILAQYLALNAGKYNFNRLQKGVFNKVPTLPLDTAMTSELPSLLTGVKLELAGRLTTQQNSPRKTVENTHTGSFKVSQSKALSSSLNFSQYASKNKLGAFTMKVWLSQKKA